MPKTVQGEIGKKKSNSSSTIDGEEWRPDIIILDLLPRWFGALLSHSDVDRPEERLEGKFLHWLCLDFGTTFWARIAGWREIDSTPLHNLQLGHVSIVMGIGGHELYEGGIKPAFEAAETEGMATCS
jgi:hypothetical protein